MGTNSWKTVAKQHEWAVPNGGQESKGICPAVLRQDAPDKRKADPNETPFLWECPFQPRLSLVLDQGGVKFLVAKLHVIQMNKCHGFLISTVLLRSSSNLMHADRLVLCLAG